ncbi:MAG: pyridoxamine 5'-phosphate oxidase [Bdellovibrionota bacterium]
MNDSDHKKLSNVPQNIRREYQHAGILETAMHTNPLEEFNLWFQSAVKYGVDQANAMSLATATKQGRPSLRQVLLKDYSAEGFVFYTNYKSRKGRELAENPQAALLFYWSDLNRQIRIEGSVEKTSADISDKYFSSRPWGAQLGAYASPQSSEIKNRLALEQLVANAEKVSSKKSIKRPEHWGGYTLKPNYFEFWQGRENRLHDRIVYELEANNWKIKRLAP